MGYLHKTMDEYNKEVQATPAEQLSRINGRSPGAVAGYLGITRQAVHDAIKRGALEAYKITHNGSTVAIIVPDSEVENYRRHHLRKRA